MALISESRLAELRALKSPDFDFRKLIRLCEELNTAFQQECYLNTAMGTRALLDHVPAVFGFKTFSEVANNYAGGGKSFKETMLHMENAARKVADAHLHMPIRRSETLPTAQQVNCGQQLDVLLSGNCSDNTVTEGPALVEINAPADLAADVECLKTPVLRFLETSLLRERC
jgi:hypothetical protein